MKFLSIVTVITLSLNGVYGVPKARSGNGIAAPEARGVNTLDEGYPDVARSIDDISKRDIEVVSRPNGPAPPSTGDPHGPPKRDLGLVKRPNGPAPPSTGDPTVPHK